MSNSVVILVFRAEWLAIFERLVVERPKMDSDFERNSPSLFLPNGRLKKQSVQHKQGSVNLAQDCVYLF